MKKEKIFFECQSCGYQTPKWMGRCPDCGKWHTITEELISGVGSGIKQRNSLIEPIPINSIKIEEIKRSLTSIKEFDRVLGGGVVPGSLILIGGDPGIGKSTLMLQVLHGLSETKKKVLYISGEESTNQIRLRSKRLGTVSSNILVASEIDLDIIISLIEQSKPDVAVIDSIQTMYNSELASAPGSIGQVRESTMKLMVMAKRTSIPIFLTGHVTKDGAIAGPRIMEHMVDTVLYFEGDRNHVFRILRAVKNRFGSTNEIGVFEMKDKGLCEVENPSALFLSQRPEKAPGSVVIVSMEGTRPILIEIQALVSSTNFGNPRRTILGLDQNRVALLTAVMEKKLGAQLIGNDIFMNVAGGVKVYEPAVDLGIIASIASGYFDKPICEKTIAIGEVGLAGEVRAVSQIEIRVAEAKKMGFNKCIVPDANMKSLESMKGIEIEGVAEIAEAVYRLKIE